MRIKNLLSKIKNVPKKYMVASAAVAVILAVPVIALAGFGPNRPTFDWNNPADRGGSMTGPVFNSFVNTPYYGDERAFVDAKDSANANQGGFADTVDVVGGKEYTIRAYVHNNANQETNASGLGVAQNTKVRFKVLPGMANGNEVTGYISADNAAPQVVYDTVKLKNDTTAFELEYVPGSARAENNAHPYPGVALSDAIVGDGAQIGYDQMNGTLPGCFQFTTIVTIKVRVKTPALEFSKGVSNAETPKKTDLVKNIEANPGDTLTWRLDYKNTGTNVARDITVRDMVPAGLTLVPGSITWVDVNHQNGETLQNTALGSGGVNVGNYAPQGNGLIRFRTRVNSDVREKNQCLITNEAFARAENIREVSDRATVTIRDCNRPTPQSLVCDLLSAQQVNNNRTYVFTARATATGGATVTDYTFDFGDGSQPQLTNSATSQPHTYAPGSYLAKVTVRGRVNGQTTTAAANARCTVPITVTPPSPEKCPMPGKEHLPKDSPECKVVPTTTLPNTGAGDLVGIVVATSIAGMIAYRLIWLRQYQS